MTYNVSSGMLNPTHSLTLSMGTASRYPPYRDYLHCTKCENGMLHVVYQLLHVCTCMNMIVSMAALMAGLTKLPQEHQSSANSTETLFTATNVTAHPRCCTDSLTQTFMM